MSTMNKRDYLQKLIPTREAVERFLCNEVKSDPEENNFGWTFHPELGCVLKDHFWPEANVNKATAYFHYDADGSRRKSNFSGNPCRVHTYGNSFTHCDQVSDGETWQEFLAAHLNEPVANYGVGGYSVYQAYRRMLLVEKENPAEFIIFNIYFDDHLRNLDPWRSLRYGRHIPGGFSSPYLKVDPDRNECVECENPCPTPAHVRRLTDIDFFMETFGDNPALDVYLISKAEQLEVKTAANVPLMLGFEGQKPDDIAKEARQWQMKSALFSTQKIIEWLELFARKNNRKLMIVLSYHMNIVRDALAGAECPDQQFLDFLRNKPYPVLNLRDVHKKDFAQFNITHDAYLQRYYIGHYSPSGNFFCAQQLIQPLTEWLVPKALVFRKHVDLHDRRKQS